MYVDPTGEQLRAFVQGEFPKDARLVMLNLLRFREHAAYPEPSNASPCSGREAYARYSAGALEMVRRAGGVVTSYRTFPSVIGPEPWDQALLVEYPSQEAFLTMISDPEYQRFTHHRTAALLDARLIPMHQP